MSIGTLLAYTIVSASVIILRYKTTKLNQKDDDTVSASTASVQSDTSYLPQPGKLKPEFWWLSHIVGGCGYNEVISGSVVVFITCSTVFCIHVNFSARELLLNEWWAILIVIFLIVCATGSLLVIGAHEQNPSTNTFRVPWVPFIPGLSIWCNIGLMVNLNVLTWVRFTVWMTIGLLVYFLYGIKYSKEGDQTSTYSMLITSSEAHKEPWGTMSPTDNATECKTTNEEPETPLLAKKQTGTSKKKEDKTALTADYDSEQ